MDPRLRLRSHIRASRPEQHSNRSTHLNLRSPETPDAPRSSGVSDVHPEKKPRGSFERSQRPHGGSEGRRAVLGGKLKKNNNKGVAPVRGRTACIVALSEVACSRGTADSIELLLSDKEVNKRSGERSGSTAGRRACDHLPGGRWRRNSGLWLGTRIGCVGNDKDISCLVL